MSRPEPPLYHVAPGLRYRAHGVPWLPQPLRLRWAERRIGDSLACGAREALAGVRGEDLDADFSPPAGAHRAVVAALISWISRDAGDIESTEIVRPVSAYLDVSEMDGWCQVPLAVWSGGQVLSLECPPTFGELLATPAIGPRDVLAAACLVEAAIPRAGAGGEAMPTFPRASTPVTEDLSPPTLSKEVADWMVTTCGLDQARASAVVERLGLEPGRRPTLAELGDRLGVSHERVRQIVAKVESTLAEDRPAFRQLHHLRNWLVDAAKRGPLTVAERLSGLTGDPSALGRVVGLLGDRRLSLFIEEIAQPLDRAFVAEVRRLVHEAGAIGIKRLVGALRTRSATLEEALYACGGDKRISVVDEVACSLREGATLAVGLRKALSATNPQPLVTAYCGALRFLRLRGVLLLPTLQEFSVFVEISEEFGMERDTVGSSATPIPPDGLEAVLLEAIDAGEGQLCDRDSLIRHATRRGYRASSAQQYSSYSPVVDLACAGVFRRRGGSVDLAHAERLRRGTSSRSRWAAWGWLDHDRFWIQCRITVEGIRPAPPRDLEALLKGRSFPLLAADRTELGQLRFDDHGAKWSASIDGEPLIEEQTSVLEFRVGSHPSVALLAGESADDDDQYPGDVDGCVLIDGRWWLVLRADDAVLSGAPCLLPAALVGRLRLQFGEEAILRSDAGISSRVRREPHAGVLLGLGRHLQAAGIETGSWVRVSVARSRLWLHHIGCPIPGTAGELLARVGLDPTTSTRGLFAAMGNALGTGGVSDRADVVNAFSRRGRVDLARLVDSLRLTKMGRDVRRRVLVRRILESAGRVLIEDSDGRTLVPVPGSGRGDFVALGLSWIAQERSGAETFDPEWWRWVNAYLSAWLGAIESGPARICFVDRTWIFDGVKFPTLVDALEEIEPGNDRAQELPLSGTVDFPETGLGFIHVVREATRMGLESLAMTRDGLVCRWAAGGSTSGVFIGAFVPPTASHVP